VEGGRAIDAMSTGVFSLVLVMYYETQTEGIVVRKIGKIVLDASEWNE
jgi:hypothetical protein